MGKIILLLKIQNLKSKNNFFAGISLIYYHSIWKEWQAM